MYSRKDQFALVQSCTVKAGSTVRKFYPVKYDGSDIVESEGTTDACIGIACEAGDGDVEKSKIVGVWMLGSPAIVPVHIGTGGITPGGYLTPGNEGAVAITPGGGTVKKMVIGQAVDTGTDGGYAGVNIGLAHTCGTA